MITGCTPTEKQQTAAAQDMKLSVMVHHAALERAVREGKAKCGL